MLPLIVKVFSSLGEISTHTAFTVENKRGKRDKREDEIIFKILTIFASVAENSQAPCFIHIFS